MKQFDRYETQYRKELRLLSILHSKALPEFKKPTFKTGDRVRILKFDLPFRKSYKPRFTGKFFEIVEIATRKPPRYTLKDEEEDIIQGKFYRKEPIKVL